MSQHFGNAFLKKPQQQNDFGNAFLKKPVHRHEPHRQEPPKQESPRHEPVPPKPAAAPLVRSALGGKAPAAPKPTYTKVFRWWPPEGQTHEPATVEIVGTFTSWQRVPLIHERKQHAWHLTLHHIPAHKTHHYMLLVDGRPAHDKNSDGLAIPHGPQEERYQLMTERGPRLFMLFAQSK
jgi:hypothetical protein